MKAIVWEERSVAIVSVYLTQSDFGRRRKKGRRVVVVFLVSLPKLMTEDWQEARCPWPKDGAELQGG